MKTTRFTFLLIAILTISFYSCSDDNSPGGSNNNNNGGGSNNGGCSGGPTTVADIDGNVYNVVTIDNQCWLKENLKTTRYKNGTPIQTGLSGTQWEANTNGACADYDDDPAKGMEYGKLYNWYAVANPNGLCPIGWHVPSLTEVTTLIDALGGSSVAGGKMKEVGITHWASPNVDATNSSGFTGLPGGSRAYDGTYSAQTFIGNFWTSNSYSSQEAHFFNLNYFGGIIYSGSYENKLDGESVRCVRD